MAAAIFTSSRVVVINENRGLIRRHRDLFLGILEEVRKEARFVVVGYVAMPEHFHVLIHTKQISLL